MRKLAAIPLLLACVLLADGAGDAQATHERKVRCSSGQTMFVEGRLRLFATSYDTPEESGHNAFACLGGRGRPVEVGGEFITSGTASGYVAAYARGGERYLGLYRVSDGEGGADAYYNVVDLRTNRSVVFANTACCEDVLYFRVASNGSLVVGDFDGVFVKPPGRGKGVSLSTSSDVTDLALVGGTVYWTENAVARSARLEGVSGAREARMFEPVTLPQRRPCPSLSGRTVVASPSVRVVERRGERIVCRTARTRQLPAGSAGGPAPRIAGDRWVLLLAADEQEAVVLDSRRGRQVIAVDAAAGGGILAATLLRNGAVAWLEANGRVLLQRPGASAPTELAPAASGATALASGHRTVYWTAGGQPHQANAG